MLCGEHRIPADKKPHEVPCSISHLKPYKYLSGCDVTMRKKVQYCVYYEPMQKLSVFHKPGGLYVRSYL